MSFACFFFLTLHIIYKVIIELHSIYSYICNSFTRQYMNETSSCHCIFQHFIHTYCHRVFLCINTSQFIYPFGCWWTQGMFSGFGYCSCSCSVEHEHSVDVFWWTYVCISVAYMVNICVHFCCIHGEHMCAFLLHTWWTYVCISVAYMARSATARS